MPEERPSEELQGTGETQAVVRNADEDVAQAENVEEAGDAEDVGAGEQLQQQQQQQHHMNNFAAGFGFEGMGVAFPNMNLGGDLNQMQMMMTMQNGMIPNTFGFPMMGAYPFTPRTVPPEGLASILTGGGRNGPDDAKHVHERWFRITRHGHERHEHDGWGLWQRWLRIQ